MKFWQKLMDKLKDNEINFYHNKVFQRVFWGIFVYIILAGLITINFFPDEVNLQVGQVSKNDIKAPKTVKYIDQERTEELKQKAADAESKVYEERVGVIPETRQKINDFFALVKKVKKAETSEEETKIEKLQDNTILLLSNQDINYLLQQSTEEIDEIKEDIMGILMKYLNRGVKSDYLENVKGQISEEIANLEAPNKYRHLLEKMVQQLIKPNLVLDLEATQQRKEEARKGVTPVTRTIQKGEIIIRHGKVVTEEDIRKLEILGLREPKINYLNIIGYLLVVLIIMLVTAIYIYQYHPYVYEDMGEMALLGLLPIIILALAKVANYLPIAYSSFVVPIAAASILIAVLIDTDLSIVFTIGISILVAIVSDAAIVDIIVGVVSGLAGIYSVTKLSQRGDLVRAGFIVGGASSITILCFMLTTPTAGEWTDLLKIVPLGMINGVMVAIVTNGLLPYVENIFGITSPVKLLELSNPNHPLLKRLLVEAPGTYHHSIIVGNLAEAAADEVGADSLLARVGAYYHDIGKLKRSYFFNENQIGAENPHDKLSPNLSTLIITSHIKDGVELAEEYKLPEVVIDIIKQHHGTSLVSFFYQEAVYDDKYETVDEDEFRYDGPKPQTKEAALIMLSDMVEAAVRSNVSVQSNPDKLEKFVRDLIKKKLNDGQLDESDLTLKDLNKIATSFVKILKGIFHNRVEYPDNIAQQFKEGKNLNGNGSQ